MSNSDRSNLQEVISVEAEFKQHPEHPSWIGDLNACWGVATREIDTDRIKWNVGLSKLREKLEKTFYFMGIRPSAETPELSNRVFCVKGGNALSGVFGSPVLMSIEKEKPDYLVGYEIKRANGEPLKNGSLHLEKIFTDLNLPGHTPVYRSVFFLPVPLEGADYETNFFPMVSTSPYDAGNYLVVENNLIAFGQISRSSFGRRLMNIDKDKKESYHKAKFTPDAQKEGKLVLPPYEGRMLIISNPLKVKDELEPGFFKGVDFRNVDYFREKLFPQTMGMPTKTIQVDTISIEKGMESQDRSAHVDAEQRFDYSPAIFDIRCLGVRRGIEDMYTADRIKALFEEAYSVLQL
jgi:hypothetical protein